MPSLDTARFLPVIAQAIATAQADAQSKPDDPAAVGRLAMVLHAHGQFGAARAAYLRAHRLDPRSFDWLYLLGAAELADGDTTAAVPHLKGALALRPDSLAAQLKLGDALWAAADSASAAQAYEKAIAHPAGLFGYGRAANHPESLEKALAAYPRYGAAQFALAQHYQRTGRAEEAQRLMAAYARDKTITPPIDDPLLAAVSDLDRSPTALIRRGMAAEADGQLAAAIELHRQALTADPKLAQAHLNLISLSARAGDPAAAERHYRDAIALNPNSDQAHYDFAVLAYQQGRRAEAKSALERTLAINPGHAAAQANLGVLLQESGQWPAARARFEKAVALDPALRMAHFQLGRLLANERRWPDAVRHLRLAAEDAGDAGPTYRYALGAVLARTGDTAAARAELTAAATDAAQRQQAELAAKIREDLARLR